MRGDVPGRPRVLTPPCKHVCMMACYAGGRECRLVDVVNTTLPPPARLSVPAAKMLAVEGRDGRVSDGRLGGGAGALARAVPGAAATQGAAALGALLRE